jgi:putative ABC transport system ATP-binding protein
MAAEPIIRLRGVTKTYGSGATAFQALKGIDMDVAAGDFVAVMGASGSGKSTTMNILGCLDVPSSGTFLFKGVPVESLDRDERALLRRRYLGFVFQGFNLLARTSALENVELPLLYSTNGGGVPPAERRKRAKAALEAVGLSDREDHHPNQLSGGQQQRVAIARALLNNPSILLADEPTGNLDSRTSVEVMDIFQALKDERGITIVLITHEQSVAEYGSRIVTFKDGHIVSDVRNVSQRMAKGELATMPVEAKEAL